MSRRDSGKQPQPSPYGGPRPSDTRRHGIGSPEGMELTEVGGNQGQISEVPQQQQQQQQELTDPSVMTSPPATTNQPTSTAATPVSPTADVAAAAQASSPTDTGDDDEGETPSKPRKRRLFFTPSPRKTPSPAPQRRPPPAQQQQPSQTLTSPSATYTTPQPTSRTHSDRPSTVGTGGSSARLSSGQQRQVRRRPPMATPQTGLSGLSTTPRSSRAQSGRRSFNPLNRISDIFSPQSPSFSRTSPGLTPIHQGSSSEDGNLSSASSDSSASSVKEPFTEQIERLNQLLTTPAQQLGDLAHTNLTGEEGDDDLDSEMEDLELSRRKLAQELSQVEFSFLGGTLPQSPDSAASGARGAESLPKEDKGDSDDDWIPLLPNVDSSEPNFSPAENLQRTPMATPSPQSGASSAQKKRSPPKSAAASLTPSSAKGNKSGVMPGLFGRFYSLLNTPPREKKDATKKAKSPDSTSAANREDPNKNSVALKSPPRPAPVTNAAAQGKTTPERGAGGEMKTPDRPTSRVATTSPFNPFGLGSPSVDEVSPSLNALHDSTLAVMGQSPDNETVGASASSGATGGISSLGMGGVSDGTSDTGTVFQSIASFGQRLGGQLANEPVPGLLGGQQQARESYDKSSRILEELDSILTPPSHRPDEEVRQYVPAVTPGDKTPYVARTDMTPITPDSAMSEQSSFIIESPSTDIPSEERFGSPAPDQQLIPSLLDATRSAQLDHRGVEDSITPQKSPEPKAFGQDPYITPPQGRMQLPSLVDAATSVKMGRKGDKAGKAVSDSIPKKTGFTPPRVVASPPKQGSRTKSPLTWGSLMDFASAEKPAKQKSDMVQKDSPYPFPKPTSSQGAESLTVSHKSETNKETVAGTMLFPITGRQSSSIGRFPSDELLEERLRSGQQSSVTDSGTGTGISGNRTGRPPRTPTQVPVISLQRHPTDEIDIDAGGINETLPNVPTTKEIRHHDPVSSRKTLSVVPILAEDSDDEMIFDADTPYNEENEVGEPKTPPSRDDKKPVSAQSSPMSQDTDRTPGTVPANSSGDTADKGKTHVENREERKSNTCLGIVGACLVIFLVVGISILVGYLTRRDTEETLQPSSSPTGMPTVSSSPTKTPNPTNSPTIRPSAMPTFDASDSPTPLGTESFTITYQIFIQNGQSSPVPETEYIPSLTGAMDILTGEVLKNIENGGAQVFWQGNLRRRKLLAVLLPTEITQITDIPCAVGTSNDLCQGLVAEVSLVDAANLIQLFRATTELAIQIGRLQYQLDKLDPDSPAAVIDSRWELPAPTPFAPPTDPPSIQPSNLASSGPSYMTSTTPSVPFSNAPTNILTSPTLKPSTTVAMAPTVSPTQFVLFEFLAQNSFDGGEKLKNPWTPQSKAYGWLTQDLQQTSYPSERILQRYAMATIFYATQGENWLSKDLWLSPASECLWYNKVGNRAPCNDNDELVNLELDVNNLGGSLPPEIGLLSNSLERITMRGGPNRFLSKSLPSELGFLTNLKIFFVRGNELSGIIPPEVGNWKGLRQLDLSRNRFEGPLPTEIGYFRNLFFFEASANSLSGLLPTEIGLMQKCEFLYFEGNVLFTSIPTEIGNLGFLKELRGGSNVLLSLPSEIGRLTSADTISFKDASIPGRIPSEIGNLQRLRFLELRNNVFSGRIPTEMGLLYQLRDQLDLSRNRLSGPIPSELGMLVELRGLKLQYNLLTGQVPSEISQLVKVTSVQLEGNELSGTIPTEVCATFNITYPSFQSDCGDFNDQCPCCTSCCVDGGEICMCRYLNTPREFLCFQQKNLPP